MKVDIKEENGGYTAYVEGWLDTNVASQLEKDFLPLMENADKSIVLDCSRLEYMSSSGLRAFLSLRKESAAKGGSVLIRNIHDEIDKVFRMTGFYKLFDIQKE